MPAMFSFARMHFESYLQDFAGFFTYKSCKHLENYHWKQN